MSAAGLARRLLGTYREGWVGLEPRARRIVLASLLFVGARMSVLTFLGVYLDERVGLPLPLIGLAFLFESLARGLVGPFAGALSDRVGRRPVILGSVGATLVLTPAFLLIQGPATLFAWSILSGLAQGPYFPSASTLLMDLVPVERRQEALAVNYTAISLGYTLAVAPAGFLAQRSFALLAGTSALLLALIGLVYLLGLRGPLPTTPRREGSVAGNALVPLRDPAFLLLAAPAFLFPMGIGLVSLVFPVFAREQGLEEGAIGLLLGATGLFLAALAIPLNAGSGPKGPFRALPVAALLSAVAYAFLALGDGWGTFLLGLTVFTVGEVLFSAALPTAVAALAPPGLRGAYQGAWALLFATGLGAAFFVSGLLRDALGWRATWLVFLAATLAAGALLLALRGRLRRTADERARLA